MPEGRDERLKVLLALEIARITRDLGDRFEFLVTTWSRHRSRDPFMDTTFTRWRTVAMGDLVGLPTDAILKVTAFYEQLDDLRMYLQFTEHMPTTLRDTLAERIETLTATAQPALDALGGEPVRPVIEASTVLAAELEPDPERDLEP